MLRKNSNGIGRLEGGSSDDAFIHDRAHRIDVTSPIEVLTLNLFGGHVEWRAHDGPAAGHLSFDRSFEQLGEPEIQYLRRLPIAAFRDDDVFGL